MSTNPDNLKSTLDQLRNQLAQIGSADSATRAQLAQILEEIQQALRSDSTSGTASASKITDRNSIIGRLRESALHFEESHPALAENIGGLISTLSSSGI